VGKGKRVERERGLGGVRKGWEGVEGGEKMG